MPCIASLLVKTVGMVPQVRSRPHASTQSIDDDDFSQAECATGHYCGWAAGRICAGIRAGFRERHAREPPSRPRYLRGSRGQLRPDSALLSLPAIAAAGLKEGWDFRHEIAASNLARPMFIASVVSFVVGLATIDWLIKFLRNHPTYVFIAYRIAVGIAISRISVLRTIK